MKMLMNILALIAFTMVSCSSDKNQETTATGEVVTETAVENTAQQEKKILLSPQELMDLKKQKPELVIIDVRTAGEYAGGIIEGAINIDYKSSNFSQKVQELDKEKEYVVYCHAGSRSARAFKIMEKMGFQNLQDLDGGMTAWEGANMPVTKN